MDECKNLAEIYRRGKGLDAGSPLNNPEFVALVKDIESGDPGMKAKCPHCKSLATIRSSKQISALVREGKCQCSNLACGHTFVINIEVVRTISPAAYPDPLVSSQLKQSERWKGICNADEDSCKAYFAEEPTMP